MSGKRGRLMFDALVDTRLSVRLGEPNNTTRVKISAQLVEAVSSVLADVLGDDPFDVDNVDYVAPWARDLARGLHWLAVHDQFDGDAPRTEDILDELTDVPLSPALRNHGAATIDIAWALTYDRVIDQIHGHQAHKRYASHNLARRAPWQDSVSLGYRIHLMLEWLRLDPRVQSLAS